LPARSVNSSNKLRGAQLGSGAPSRAAAGPAAAFLLGRPLGGAKQSLRFASTTNTQRSCESSAHSTVDCSCYNVSMSGSLLPTEGVEWASSVAAADWILDELHAFGSDVGAFVPSGFETHARILHSAWRLQSSSRQRVCWAELATKRGASLQATTRFEDLAPERSDDLEAPLVGSLDVKELNALLEVLRDFTPAGEVCWFGWWQGYAWMAGFPARVPLAAGQQRIAKRSKITPSRERVASIPVFGLPQRPTVLYRGPIEGAAAFIRPPASQSPNLWWPNSRSWCVASEVDFRSTYIGGSRQTITRLLEHGDLEAIPVLVTDPVTD